MLKNWKTTASGTGVILAALASALSELATGAPIGQVVGAHLAAVIGGVGLLFSKDFNVTGGGK